MNNNIFIPKKLNIGFQKRADTYTGKLAYIIYFDEKGVLKKENSWSKWKDESVENIICDNIPISGLVLNKKAGDYGGRNYRQAYIRVYDPRDFEFEITVENLLYILESTNSIKGKGLEGEFIYGWDGPELILIPTSSPDYQDILKYNEIIYNNKQIKVKDLVIGNLYRTKDNLDYMYMGRFDRWISERDPKIYSFKSENKGQHHFFIRKVKVSEDYIYIDKIILKSLGSRFIEEIELNYQEYFDELFDLLEHDTEYSPLDESKNEYVKYTLEEFSIRMHEISWRFEFYNSDKQKINIRKTRDKLWEVRQGDIYNKTKLFRTIEDIYDSFEPHYRNEYLVNGKLYKEGK